ncbi:MAG: YfhO family protein [Candidatus Nitrohelix vancouverensis]|uniref:YfhO family protein n=1 Tax=Candidatus Nitrohelix vancouverensis TaxID=2705534 RepID=A0A7T0C2K7_9BACT|nr:MAG: YfhO family protein [Candidatus Nitrohelix vancouverensis]
MDDSHSTPRSRPFWLIPSLLLILLAKNLPGFYKWTLPVHDNLCVYESFYFFYNDLLLHNEIPSWTPFIVYGMPTDFEFVRFLTAGKYLAGLLGWLFSIQDTLLVYQFAIFAEELVLLYGMYKLADRLFQLDATVFYVCLVAILSIITIRQPGMGYHIYYMYPLMFHLLLSFLEEKDYRYFFGAGIVFVVAQLGGTGYTMPLQLATLFCFFFFAALAHVRDLKDFVALDGRRRRNFLVSLALLSIVAITYYRFATLSMESLEFVSYLRDPETSKVSLMTFLTYGKVLKPENLLYDMLWPMAFRNDFPSLYIGAIPLIFCFYAVFKVRDWRFYSVTLTGIFLFCFAMGSRTPLAVLLYDYFPFMQYYRHVSYAVGGLIIIFAIMSGYGFDKFFTSNSVETTLSRIRPENIAIGLTLFNLAIFQMMTDVYYHNKSHVGRQTVIDSDYFNVHPYNYQNIREISRSVKEGLPVDRRQRKILSSNIHILGELDYRLYNHLQWDVCLIPARIDFSGKNVEQFFNEHDLTLFEEKGGWLDQSDSFYENEVILSKLGCNFPKMHIVNNAEVEGDALRTVTFEPDRLGTVQILNYRANYVEVGLDNPFDETSFLYYADLWSAGWDARVNGRSTPILKANTAFKAVAIPAGQSIVEFHYETPHKILRWILIVYGLCFICWVLIGILLDSFENAVSRKQEIIAGPQTDEKS